MQLPIPECYDSPEDALKSVVMAMGGFKEVGRRMRPDFDHSGEWLRKCLSGDRRERLDPGQVLWLLREARRLGFHTAFDYFAGEAGYKATPVEAEKQVADLQTRIAEGLAALNAHMSQLEKLQERAARQ